MWMLGFFLHMWVYTDCVYFFLMSKLQGRICLIIPRIGSLFCNLDLNWEQLLFFLINNFSFFFFLINNFLSMGKVCECIGQVWLLVKKMVIELMNLVKYIFLFSYRLGTGSALSPLTVLTLHPSHSLSTLRATTLNWESQIRVDIIDWVLLSLQFTVFLGGAHENLMTLLLLNLMIPTPVLVYLVIHLILMSVCSIALRSKRHASRACMSLCK